MPMIFTSFNVVVYPANSTATARGDFQSALTLLLPDRTHDNLNGVLYIDETSTSKLNLTAPACIMMGGALSLPLYLRYNVICLLFLAKKYFLL